MGWGTREQYALTQDVREAPEQRANAVVTGVADQRVGRYGVDLKGLIYLEINGQPVVTTAPVRSLDPLHKGQKVNVGYRVGKSGKIQVDWMQPVGDAQP